MQRDHLFNYLDPELIHAAVQPLKVMANLVEGCTGAIKGLIRSRRVMLLSISLGWLSADK